MRQPNSEDSSLVHVPRLGGAGLASSWRNFRVVLASKDTDGIFSHVEIRWHVGQITPLFAHTREVKLYNITEGRFEADTGTDRFEVRRGARLYIPKHQPLALRCLEEGTIASTYIPAGIEQMYAELAMFDLDQLGEELITLSKLHGVEILKSADEVWK